MTVVLNHHPFLATDRLFKPEWTDPAGESLDETGEVDALLRMSSGVPQTEVAGQVIPERAADWPAVEDRVVELLERSIDIRLIILLAEAVLRSNRLPAFVDCLRVIAEMVRDHWEHWYPRTFLKQGGIDVEERENVLAELQASRLVRSMRSSRPFSVPSLRGTSIGDLLKNGQGEAPDLQVLRNALAEPAARADVERTTELLRASLQALHDIGTALQEHGVLIDFSRLSGVLSESAAALGCTLNDEGRDAEAAVAVTATADAPPSRPGNRNVAMTELSRDSARVVIQELIDYFLRVEPSSPVPLYLDRAKALIGLGFVDAVREMGKDVEKFSQT